MRQRHFVRYRLLALPFGFAGLLMAVPAAGQAGAEGLRTTAASQPAVPDALRATSGRPWGRAEAAHLLRRAGFGGTPEQIRELVKLGRDAAVDSLVDYERIPQTDPDYSLEGLPEEIPPMLGLAQLVQAQRQQVRQLLVVLGNEHMNAMREWWVRRMVVTPRPLEEKMTLFWHGLLTSGFREVKRPRLMHAQHDFLRRHALADWGTILRGISRDGAMLAYLDNGKNVKGHPNENYARELLELFTLGEGNYSEQDVLEAARAFTGWSHGPNGFAVRPRQHDNGPKTFLGQTGRWDGDDIIAIVLQQPAAGDYLARRLWVFFVSPEPDEPAVAALADQLTRSNYSLKESLRVLFKSDAFYTPQNRFALIKSPVELVVGTARLLEVAPADLRSACDQLKQMGQELFQPPNVKGWTGDRAWINTSALFVRYNAMAGYVYGTERRLRDPVRRARLQTQLASLSRPPTMKMTDDAGDEAADDEVPMNSEKPLPVGVSRWLSEIELPPDLSAPQPVYDPLPALKADRLDDARAVAGYFVDRMLQMKLSRERQNVLVEALQKPDGRFSSEMPLADHRVRAMLYLLLSMPEYQLQ